MQRYFFDRDDSCHWYMIPAERREDWTGFMNRSDDCDDAPDWAQRINSPIDFTFENPIEG